MSKALDRYAVAGNPVDHSLSPRIHALFAEATGQAMEYTRLPVPHGQFDVTVGAFLRRVGAASISRYPASRTPIAG
ncbi:MAG: hypothetical protein R3E84_00600 [Pseudomonadales bacterium]